MNMVRIFKCMVLCLMLNLHLLAQPDGRWTIVQAKAWYAKQPWLVGANFIPSNAINQLEMWQAETFDTLVIDRELGYAESIGMNCMRVFLHNLVYEENAKGYLKRINTFLSIAHRHKIKIILVFFDSVWDPYPYKGKQRDPLPGVHNSGWVQGPGLHALRDSSHDQVLEKYVRSIVKRFSKDERILCWDIWNEPDNMNGYPYNAYEPANKVDLVLRIIKKAFHWVRSQQPIQPVTTYVCGSGWADVEMAPMKDVQELVQFIFDNEDIISFHNYSGQEGFEMIARRFTKYDRPVLCTEFMARGNGCTFQAILPIARKLNIGIICWGLVEGKTNTIHGWDTWTHPDKGEPALWHHDVFRKDGRPFSSEEVDFIRQMTGYRGK